MGAAYAEAPTVVETVPANGSTNIDPGLNQLSVTFDQPMREGNWSWAYTQREQFPETTGTPSFLPGNKTNVLPVRLRPGTHYVIWINSRSHRNFKNPAGETAVPYVLEFSTAPR